MTAVQYDFDAIVVGSGVSGGWAAKELTEKGLKVLVLERGKPLQHGAGYLGEHVPMWKMPYQGKPDRKLEAQEYPVQSQSHAFNEGNRHFWNNDKDNPYAMDEGKPFNWFRGDVVGGRSLTWGRQCYRFSVQDFEANKNDGNGLSWPVNYDDIAPWYSYVEKFIGVNGKKENLPQLPDGEFQQPMKWHAIEKTIKKRLDQNAPDIVLTNGRAAVLTENLPGRAACHYCGPCERGCSTGSYFSSLSSTLPAATATGNLTLRANALVERLELDRVTQRVSRVHVIDTETHQRMSFSAPLFFLCASTAASTQILLNSASAGCPNGLANSSGVLGHYLMDHFSQVGAVGMFADHMDTYYHGYRPTGLYIPRFKNVGDTGVQSDFLRGYGYQTHAARNDWMSKFNTRGFGANLKNKLRKPEAWMWYLIGFGECLPNKNNRMYLSKTKKDRYGIAQLVFEFSWGENEKTMAKDMQAEALRIMKAAGAVQSFPMGDTQTLSVPGNMVHEMGTARMGSDPSESVVNRYNQTHDVANLFITDGSFMTSSSCVNPSLTYMAFTARACDYAVSQWRAGNI